MMVVYGIICAALALIIAALTAVNGFEKEDRDGEEDDR